MRALTVSRFLDVKKCLGGKSYRTKKEAIIANECIFQEIGENLIRLTSTKPAKQLLAAGEFIHRTFGHSSVANGDLTSTDYMTPLFNWERRFRVNIEHRKIWYAN